MLFRFMAGGRPSIRRGLLVGPNYRRLLSLRFPLPIGELSWEQLSAFWPAEMDFADASDGGDERRLNLAGEMAHFGYREFERGAHIVARHVSGSKDELADSVLLESALFQEVVANTFVGSQEDPALRTYHRQPSLIRSAPRKMSKVTLETDAELC